MKVENVNYVPVLLGADLGAYSVARAFYEYSGMESYLLSRKRLLLSAGASFTRPIILESMDDCDVAVPALITLAKGLDGKRPILIPLADWYVQMTEYARDTLRGYFYFNIPSFEAWKTVSDKYSFSKLLSKFAIPTPKTELISSQDTSALGRIKGPYVVKASDSTEYWRHSFDGMRKVYPNIGKEEVIKTVGKIEGSGYPGRIILQEYVRGKHGPASSAVLTTYSGIDGKVARAVYSRVLLRERGRTSEGNYSALITLPPDPICDKLIKMLDAIGYTGFANFDILLTDNGALCLELNPRLGRSCDHLRGAGVDIAALILEDNDDSRGVFDYGQTLWRSVPYSYVKRYTEDKELISMADALRRSGKEFTPYKGIDDLPLIRRAYFMIHSIRRGIAISREARSI